MPQGVKLSLCVPTDLPSLYPILNSLFIVSTLDFLFHLEPIFFSLVPCYIDGTDGADQQKAFI